MEVLTLKYKQSKLDKTVQVSRTDLTDCGTVPSIMLYCYRPN